MCPGLIRSALAFNRQRQYQREQRQAKAQTHGATSSCTVDTDAIPLSRVSAQHKIVLVKWKTRSTGRAVLRARHWGLVDKFKGLAADPLNIRKSKPLRGSRKRTARVGSYRILFIVEQNILLISDVHHRNGPDGDRRLEAESAGGRAARRPSFCRSRRRR